MDNKRRRSFLASSQIWVGTKARAYKYTMYEEEKKASHSSIYLNYLVVHVRFFSCVLLLKSLSLLFDLWSGAL